MLSKTCNFKNGNKYKIFSKNADVSKNCWCQQFLFLFKHHPYLIGDICGKFHLLVFCSWRVIAKYDVLTIPTFLTYFWLPGVRKGVRKFYCHLVDLKTIKNLHQEGLRNSKSFMGKIIFQGGESPPICLA